MEFLTKEHKDTISLIEKLVNSYKDNNKPWKKNNLEVENEGLIKKELLDLFEWVRAIFSIINVEDLSFECSRITSYEEQISLNDMHILLKEISDKIYNMTTKLKEIGFYPGRDILLKALEEVSREESEDITQTEFTRDDSLSEGWENQTEDFYRS